ncbi:MAG: 16S rRNA (cytosine(1402)-N(4))-methyltransferase RsmH [Sphingomonadaceae bacterium]
MSADHVPVLLDEVMTALAPVAAQRHIDGTYGAGGYSAALLATGAEVIGFDRDPDAIAAAVPHERLTLIEDRFSRLDQAGAVDGVVLDIGVSSMQLDRPERGFSFQADGPLDMRMELTGPSAADFVNTAGEGEIADVIYTLGDEPKSRRIARAIVAARPLTTTTQLANVVRRATGHKPHEKKDPATRTFQAIRLHVNRELGELEDGLDAAERALKPGGRLAVVTFHSLEDRLVKTFLRRRSGSEPAGSRHLPVSEAGPRATFDRVAKPVRASDAEVARNPRSRSATLRSARRTDAPSWTSGGSSVS